MEALNSDVGGGSVQDLGAIHNSNDTQDVINEILKSFEVEEQEAAGDNAVYFPSNNVSNDIEHHMEEAIDSVVHNPTTTTTTDGATMSSAAAAKVKGKPGMQNSKKNNSKDKDNKTIKNEWVLVHTNDFPFFTWADNTFQYTLRDPANCGNVLLRVQLFSDNVPIYKCGLYLNTFKPNKNNNEDIEIYNTLVQVLTRLQMRWMNIDNMGILKTANALPMWRTANAKSCIYPITTKRNERKRKVTSENSNATAAATVGIDTVDGVAASTATVAPRSHHKKRIRPTPVVVNSNNNKKKQSGSQKTTTTTKKKGKKSMPLKTRSSTVPRKD